MSASPEPAPVSGFGYHAIERAALGFVLEGETWPLFLAWVRENHVSGAARDWADTEPDLAKARLQYTAHSPDPAIRALTAQADLT